MASVLVVQCTYRFQSIDGMHMGWLLALFIKLMQTLTSLHKLLSSKEYINVLGGRVSISVFNSLIRPSLEIILIRCSQWLE